MPSMLGFCARKLEFATATFLAKRGLFIQREARYQLARVRSHAGRRAIVRTDDENARQALAQPKIDILRSIRSASSE
jgi:hypothetical protein